MCISAVAELEVEGTAAVKTTVSKLAQACNQLVSMAGFSPNQWVLSAGIRLPASLANASLASLRARASGTASRSSWSAPRPSFGLRTPVLYDEACCLDCVLSRGLSAQENC